MEKKKVAVPLVCHGHSRPVVDLYYSPITPDGFFLISASKGMYQYQNRSLYLCVWIEKASVAVYIAISFIIGMYKLMGFYIIVEQALDFVFAITVWMLIVSEG